MSEAPASPKAGLHVIPSPVSVVHAAGAMSGVSTNVVEFREKVASPSPAIAYANRFDLWTHTLDTPVSVVAEMQPPAPPWLTQPPGSATPLRSPRFAPLRVRPNTAMALLPCAAT